jgi:hypothetical protein
MSIKKADRTESVFEAISHAIYMRGQFDLLFIRNMGIKNQDSILRQKYDIPILTKGKYYVSKNYKQ